MGAGASQRPRESGGAPFGQTGRASLVGQLPRASGAAPFGHAANEGGGMVGVAVDPKQVRPSRPTCAAGQQEPSARTANPGWQRG